MKVHRCLPARSPRRVANRALVGLLAFALAPLALAAESGTIQFNIRDGQGQLLPCRIHLLDAQGKPQQPAGQPFWNDHFVCAGRAAVELEPGQYSWQIERGPEHQRAAGTVSVASGQTQDVNVTLARIASLRQAGWYCGDLHVHRPAGDVRLLMQAEDLDFAPVIEWWNARGGDLAAVAENEIAFDGHRVYQLRAGEDEREGGALLYFGLNGPLDLTATSREFPSPMHFVAQARERNKAVWIDIEKPFWWDVPAWLASGQMNSMGIANNHMCRSRMYESEAWGRPRELARLPKPLGNGYWTQEIYYHALNAGLRIPPSAGSASGVLPNPVGYNRVYVHLGDEQLNRNRWFNMLARGQCFVTNGPLLRVTAGKEHPGKVFQLPKTGGVNIDLQIALTFSDPVSAVEVIYNGRIVKRLQTAHKAALQPVPTERIQPSPDGQVAKLSRAQHEQLSTSLTITEPGWFLVRAIADVDRTFRFASTAPWYVEGHQGQRRISQASSQFFLDWVDERIERVRKNVSDPTELRSILEPHATARDFWQKRVGAANADLDAQDRRNIAETSSADRP